MGRGLIGHHDIRLATAADAQCIALLSRDHIEQGLGWRWTPMRIVRMINDPASNVAVAYGDGQLTGFGIMRYKDDEAHLLLLAVAAAHRRRGVGTALMNWLEATALTAGIGFVYLEARTRNADGRAFYRALGYTEVDLVRRLYSNEEDGVRIAKDLWLNA